MELYHFVERDKGSDENLFILITYRSMRIEIYYYKKVSYM